MTSEIKRAASKRNGALSRGPTTPATRQKTIYNNLSHGMRVKCDVLPCEDEAMHEEREAQWAAIEQPRDDMEVYLNYRNVCNSWELDRIKGHINIRLTKQIEEGASRDEAEVDRLYDHLIWDRRGAITMHGFRDYFTGEEGTSHSGDPDDPDKPARLLKALEATAAGCAKLYDGWKALYERLKNDQCWQSHDRLVAIRLMGLQPADVLKDRRASVVYLASSSLHYSEGGPYQDLRCDLTKEELPRFTALIRERWGPFLDPCDREKARRMLTELVAAAMERLAARVELLSERAEEDAQRMAIDRSFEYTAAGALARRYEELKSKTFSRERGAIARHRKEMAQGRALAPWGEGEPGYDDLVAANFTIDGVCASLAKERAAAGCLPRGLDQNAGSGVSDAINEAILVGETDMTQLVETGQQMTQGPENWTFQPTDPEPEFGAQVSAGIEVHPEIDAEPVVKSEAAVVKSEVKEPGPESGQTAELGGASRAGDLGGGDPFVRALLEPQSGKKMSSRMRRRERKKLNQKEAREANELKSVERLAAASLKEFLASGKLLLHPMAEAVVADLDARGELARAMQSACGSEALSARVADPSVSSGPRSLTTLTQSVSEAVNHLLADASG